MPTYDASIGDLIKSALRDAQDLVRSEIALAKVEARAEASRLVRGAVLLGSAALAAVMGIVFLMTTVAWAISELAQWPVWSGFAIVTVVALVAGGVLAMVGRKRMRARRHMARTVDTLKENLEWMRARTS
jgi:uncharacterized membrane protein YqjE